MKLMVQTALVMIGLMLIANVRARGQFDKVGSPDEDDDEPGRHPKDARTARLITGLLARPTAGRRQPRLTRLNPADQAQSRVFDPVHRRSHRAQWERFNRRAPTASSVDEQQVGCTDSPHTGLSVLRRGCRCQSSLDLGDAGRIVVVFVGAADLWWSNEIRRPHSR